MDACGASDPGVCRAPVGAGFCGETKTLEIVNEFRRLYEEKMKEVEEFGGGDNLELKMKLQQEWIRDLSEQNEMLVRAVEELEYEATGRVQMLEDKLQQSANCICEVMNKYRQYDVTNEILAEPLEKIFRLENDQKNLLEFIRRIREGDQWQYEGLKFYEISFKDLFGSDEKPHEYLINNGQQEQEKNKEKEKLIEGLEKKLNHFYTYGDIDAMKKELVCKREECETLKQTMVDTRQALTEEVAQKHDIIIQLKKENQELEERCIQSDKQTAFRDDIIKELRKEIKHLKQQHCNCLKSETTSLNGKISDLCKLNDCLKSSTVEDKSQIECLENRFKEFLKEKEHLKRKCKTCMERSECLENENRMIRCEYESLRVKVGVFLKDNEEYAMNKVVLESEVKKLHENLKGFEQATKKISELENDNKKLTKDLILINEENRNLLKALESQKHKLQCNSRITQEEIDKLHTTIDDLQKNLQHMKLLQEEDDKVKEGKIAQLKHTVVNLEIKLQEAEEKKKTCSVCKGKLKVGFMESEEVQATPDHKDELHKHMKLLEKRDQIIRVQNETLSLIQGEMETLKSSEAEATKLKETQSEEIRKLHAKVSELEEELGSCGKQSANLQMAVGFYKNSINVLEAAEEKYKLEINQQKLTISNLQKALVNVKQDLDSARQRSEENGIEELKLIDNFISVTLHNEETNEDLLQEILQISRGYEHLQELNLELELEHCYSLQDLGALETQVHKYRTLLKSEESELKECQNQLKKMWKQNMCYEEIVSYFKKEMVLMSDQMHNLQEMLNLSHSSVEQEKSNLHKAFLSTQEVNQQLCCQLSAAEQRIQLENQMNQLNEAKIDELERILSDKDIDIGRHGKAIDDIRQTLRYSLKQNEDMLGTIVVLNGMVMELQGAINQYEEENMKSKEVATTCQEQINSCRCRLEELKEALEKKTTELCKLEMAYNSQSRSLKNAQTELREMKQKQRENKCHVRCVIEDVQEKQRKAEEKYKGLEEEYKKLETQLGIVVRRENVKDVEIKRYRKIIGDLKKTLTEINNNLFKKNFKSKCEGKECKKYHDPSNPVNLDEVCLECPCEIEFYQGIVETLKKSVIDLKAKLADTQHKNEALEEKCKNTEARLDELSKNQEEKDKEYLELRKLLTEKLQQAQVEESRYLELGRQFEKELGNIRQELETRTMQLNDVRRNALEVNSSKCVQLASAQDEVNQLKEELNKLMRKHCTLNNENEKLHSQSTKMQTTIITLEQNSQLLKGQLQQYLSELQTVQMEKEALMQKNRELLGDLRNIQTSSTRQQKTGSDTIKSLEQELNDVKHSREEITFESRNVINYFRSWLQEQKKINEYVTNRERDYIGIINRLRQENDELQFKPSTYVKSVPFCVRTPGTSPPPVCQSPWSLGSQGTASYHDNSPSGSPCLNDECDWYAASFRNYSEDEEEDEEDWVSKVENLAAQVRKTNRMWKKKLGDPECSDCMVSKDSKK